MSNGDIIKLAEKLRDAWLNKDDETQNEPRFQPFSLGKLLSTELPESEWVAKNLIPKGITIISGTTGVFKTWLLLYFGICIAKGEPIFGIFETEKLKVLIIDEENGFRVLQDRFNLLLNSSATSNSIHDSIVISSLAGLQIDQKDDFKTLLDFAKTNNINVVIFDPFVRIHSKDENKADEMAKVTGKLKEFVKEGIYPIIAHHHGKDNFYRRDISQSYRGSSEIGAMVDCHLMVDKKDDFLLINQIKLRTDKELTPFKIQIYKSDEKMVVDYLGEYDEAKLKREEAEVIICDCLKGKEWTERKQIISTLDEQGYGESTTDAALKSMELQGRVASRQKPENRTIKEYKLAETELNGEMVSKAS